MLALGAGMAIGLRLARAAGAGAGARPRLRAARRRRPSIQRAGVMGAAGLVAALAGRPASRWYALGLAAGRHAGAEPAGVGRGRVAAVVRRRRRAARARARWREALRRAAAAGPIADAAAVTAAATVATAPLMAFHFQQVSLASLPANLAAAPAVAPMMWLGMLAIAAAQVSPALCGPLNALNGPLLAYVEWVAHVAAEPPAAAMPVRIGRPRGARGDVTPPAAAALWAAARGLGVAPAVARPRRTGGRRRGAWRRRRGWAPCSPSPGSLSRPPFAAPTAAARRARGLVPRRRPGRRDAAAARRRLDPRRHRPARRPDPRAAQATPASGGSTRCCSPTPRPTTRGWRSRSSAPSGRG